MSLRMALLGELLYRPRSGYELVQRFDAALVNVWTASQSSIYPELVKMEREGLIETVERGARGRKTYGPTDAGREAVRSWLAEEPVRQVRDELILRVFMLGNVPDEDALAQLEALESLYAAKLAAYQRIREHQAGTPIADRADLFDRISLAAGISHETAMLQWAREARAMVEQHAREA